MHQPTTAIEFERQAERLIECATAMKRGDCPLCRDAGVPVTRVAAAARRTPVRRAPKRKLQPAAAELARVVTVNGRRRLPSRQKFSDQELLEALAENHGLLCSEAAARFHVSEPAMRNRLTHLVEDGLALKGGDKKFRRAVAGVAKPAVN